MALHNKKTCEIHDILFELTFRIIYTNKIHTTYMYPACSKIQQQKQKEIEFNFVRKFSSHLHFLIFSFYVL